MSRLTLKRERKLEVEMNGLACDACGTQAITGPADPAMYELAGLVALDDERFPSGWGCFGRLAKYAPWPLPGEEMHFCPDCAPAAFAALKGLRK